MKIIIILVVIATIGICWEQACYKDKDCDADEYCTNCDGTGEGNCTLKQEEGHGCTRNNECQKHLFCNKAGKCKKARKKCKFSINCKHEFWCDAGFCKPMVEIGECCTKNDECIALSKCVPLGGGTCEETCRVDNDCLQFVNGKKKYCTVGGTAGTQKGKCVMKHEQGYRCARSPECKGKMYCRNGQCQVTEEVTICSLNCHGPDPRQPDKIRPGSIVNITYSCTFIRRAEFGHQNLKAKLTLDRTLHVGNVSGLSPQYFSGFETKIARKGEFSASLDAVMKPCTSNKDSCQANRKCILNAGQ